MNNWEDIAHYCEETYGTLVDWTERFFLCPECKKCYESRHLLCNTV